MINTRPLFNKVTGNLQLYNYNYNCSKKSMRLQSIATIVGSVKDAAYVSGNKEIVICTDDIYLMCFEKKYKLFL